MTEYPQNYVGTKVIRKNPHSQDPNEHTFIDYVDKCGNYVNYTIQLPDEDVEIALDDLYYSIVDELYYEHCDDITDEEHIHTKQNYELVKKYLQALVVLKDLFDFDFALRFPDNQPMLKITNKRTNEYWELPISKEEYELLKEVLQ